MNKTLLVINLFFPLIKCVNLNLVFKDIILVDCHYRPFILPPVIFLSWIKSNQIKMTCTKISLEREVELWKVLDRSPCPAGWSRQTWTCRRGWCSDRGCSCACTMTLAEKICWVMLSNKTSYKAQWCKILMSVLKNIL